MRFAPLFASACAFASIASAAPVGNSVKQEKRLGISLSLGNILNNAKVTSLKSIVSSLEAQVVPVLNSIESLVSTEGIDAILAGIDVSVDATVADPDTSAVSLAPLESLVSDLTGTLSTDQITAIVSTLTDLGDVSPTVYSLLEQILTALGFLTSAQSQIESLVSSSGATGILASLTNTNTILAQLNSIISTLFVTLNTILTQLATALSNGATDTASLSAAIQALQSPLDTSVASIIVGANTIITGLSALLAALLGTTSTLQGLSTTNGVTSSLSSIISTLGLTSIMSALGL